MARGVHVHVWKTPRHRHFVRDVARHCARRRRNNKSCRHVRDTAEACPGSHSALARWCAVLEMPSGRWCARCVVVAQYMGTRGRHTRRRSDDDELVDRSTVDRSSMSHRDRVSYVCTGCGAWSGWWSSNATTAGDSWSHSRSAQCVCSCDEREPTSVAMDRGWSTVVTHPHSPRMLLLHLCWIGG
jgi:hypothetical protein